jgi:hypothetical protein
MDLAEDSQSLAFAVALASGACELKHSLDSVTQPGRARRRVPFDRMAVRPR